MRHMKKERRTGYGLFLDLTSTHRQACGVAFGQPDRPVGLPSGSPE